MSEVLTREIGTDPQRDGWIFKVLGVAIAGGQPGDAGKGGLVALQTSRLAWDNVRKSVQEQLQSIEKSLIAAVAAHNADETAEDEYDSAEIAKAAHSIYTILDKLDTRLIDKLDQALNADGAKRAEFQTEAAAIVKEYQAVAAGDPLLSHIDSNGFAQTTIRDVVQKTLADLARQL
jgi:paraquat-inducible protein B